MIVSDFKLLSTREIREGLGIFFIAAIVKEGQTFACVIGIQKETARPASCWAGRLPGSSEVLANASARAPTLPNKSDLALVARRGIEHDFLACGEFGPAERTSLVQYANCPLVCKKIETYPWPKK